jgi:murein L,D-transpeptidase YafK
MKQLVIYKKERRLSLLDDSGREILSCPIGLGSSPLGPKEREGDGRTPEGTYFICLKRETGKYGMALGISYPNEEDAQSAFIQGRIDEKTLAAIISAIREGRRPPWGTALGGEIYLHGGGASDWTAGCIALSDADMKNLFPLMGERDQVIILP